MDAAHIRLHHFFVIVKKLTYKVANTAENGATYLVSES